MWDTVAELIEKEYARRLAVMQKAFEKDGTRPSVYEVADLLFGAFYDTGETWGEPSDIWRAMIEHDAPDLPGLDVGWEEFAGACEKWFMIDIGLSCGSDLPGNQTYEEAERVLKLFGYTGVEWTTVHYRGEDCARRNLLCLPTGQHEEHEEHEEPDAKRAKNE